MKNPTFPEDWSRAFIIPLLKGEKSGSNNNRGISLLPVLSKVFTAILNRLINDWCIENGILCQGQGGVSTVYNIFIVNTPVKKYKQKQG